MTHYPALSLVEIERVEGIARRFGERFLKRCFTEGELSYSMPRAARHAHLAARLAAKVAVRTAFRAAGLAPPPLREIEVVRDARGAPAARLARPAPGVTVLLSLSHGRRDAAASVILGVEQPAHGMRWHRD